MPPVHCILFFFSFSFEHYKKVDDTLPSMSRNYFTAPSLCKSFFPLESSPFFFLEEYMSSGALMGLPGPTVAGPEPGMCGRTVGEAALLGGPDFSNGT